MKMEELLLQMNLQMVNDPDGIPTFWTDRGESKIDVTLVSETESDRIRQWRVETNVTSRDQRAIAYQLYLENIGENKEPIRPPRYGLRMVDWEYFKRMVQEESSNATTQPEKNLDEHVRDLLQIIT